MKWIAKCGECGHEYTSFTKTPETVLRIKTEKLVCCRCGSNDIRLPFGGDYDSKRALTELNNGDDVSIQFIPSDKGSTTK